MAKLKRSQHLKLELKDIQEATENFKTCIGKGGFGMVYKGELIMNGKQSTIAAKRLSGIFGQGIKEFLNEVDLLTDQVHRNIITLLGYCDEGEEKIIVYEYAERGSLNQYIRRHESSYTLTWVKRLEICADAARGLDHLHRHAGKHKAIIHRDIKSANILLDENWVAKISDLGLSKLSFVDRSEVFTDPAGTLGYCDPEYYSSGILKKESDIYSFGVVLFEVLCGMPCRFKLYDGFKLLAKLAKDRYENKNLNEIIDPHIKDQISPSSLNKFSTVAYECLHNDRAQRPPIEAVTKVIEESLKIQMEYELFKKEEEYWNTKLPDDSEEIIERLKPGLKQYSTRKELFMLLYKGFFFDDGERFFSIDDDGKKSEKISSKRFVKQKSRPLRETQRSGQHLLRDESNRSPMILYPHNAELNLYFQLSTRMLSTNTMYAANLVFSFKEWDGHSSLHLDSSRWVWIKWKCEDLCVSSAHFARRRDDGNFKATLWHFLSTHKDSYFDIILMRLLGGEEEKLPYIIIHELEFEPLEMIKSHNGNKEIQDESISDQDNDGENKLPDDYEHIINRSHTRLDYTTKKELYSILCVGILIDNDKKWFSLCESTGEKCHMLAAVDVFRIDSNYEPINRLSLSESRFKEGIHLQHAPQYYFTCELEGDMFSFGKLYGIYLVFKFVDGDTKPDTECLLEAYCELNYKKTSTVFAHLNTRETIPVIQPKKKNTKLRNLWNMSKAKGYGVPKWSITGTHNWMKKRDDGWMEVLLCKPFDELQKYNSLNIRLRSFIGSFYGTIVQGIEFRPLEKDV